MKTNSFLPTCDPNIVAMEIKGKFGLGIKLYVAIIKDGVEHYRLLSKFLKERLKEGEKLRYEGR